MTKGATLSYLASDHLGGTSLVMDTSGNATSRMRYHPYGQVWTQSAAPATDKLFTGHTRLGARSGMYYAGARFYSADLGRFMSADPMGPTPGLPASLNSYAYAMNNPLAYTDPTGECIPDITCGGLWKKNKIDPRPKPGVTPHIVPIIPMLTLDEIVGPAGKAKAASKIIMASGAFCALYGDDAFGAFGGTMFSDGGDLDEALEQARREGIEAINEEPELLEGASPADIEWHIPEGWIVEPTRTGGGIFYRDPEKHGDGIRVMPGYPGNPDPVKQGPYARVTHNGHRSPPIPLQGNPTLTR